QNFTGVSDPYEPPENPETVCRAFASRQGGEWHD
ncbi:MAG TPA: adenylyl-sulfate kinase, partial [Planctomycetaceae bacterium]|nr:adenylyl-sulfate kinase [Planctomycetaceae bacterium]